VTRGKRSIRIFGERLKPILADAVYRAKVGVLNRVAATNFIFDGERVRGAYGSIAGTANYMLFMPER